MHHVVRSGRAVDEEMVGLAVGDPLGFVGSTGESSLTQQMRGRLVTPEALHGGDDLVDAVTLTPPGVECRIGGEHIGEAVEGAGVHGLGVGDDEVAEGEPIIGGERVGHVVTIASPGRR